MTMRRLPMSWQAVEEELARANGFFRGSPIVLHFGERLLQKEEWWQLKETLHREEVLLRYVISSNADSRQMLYKEGLSVREHMPSPRTGKTEQGRSSARRTARLLSAPRDAGRTERSF